MLDYVYGPRPPLPCDEHCLSTISGLMSSEHYYIDIHTGRGQVYSSHFEGFNTVPSYGGTVYIICDMYRSTIGHIVPLRWRYRVIFQDPTVPSGLVYWLYVVVTDNLRKYPFNYQVNK